MRGRNAEKPWIGTFGFEPEDGSPRAPVDPADVDGRSKSSDGPDVEKSSGSASASSGQSGDKGKDDPNLVSFDGPDDTLNPMNWAPAKKWRVTTLFGLMTFVITFASSIFSTATMPTAKEYSVSPEVMLLGTSLFVIGFAFGPIVFGPMSELYGRKIPLYLGYFIFAIFNIPVALAQNLHTIFICRFLGGFFGSAPLAIVGGALADMHGPVKRGYALCIFSAATFMGPAAGPIVGSFITQSYLGWRWTGWITAILGFSIAILTFPFVPETYAQVILTRKAARQRFETKKWAYHSPQDEQKTTASAIVNTYLKRPFVMMGLEPILVLITIYISLIYGILYLFFEAFPIAFSEMRGWTPAIATLPFIALLIGVLLGATIISLITHYRYKPVYERVGATVPEERLVPMFIGGALLPAGLFWFAWTSSPNISWVPQVISIIPIGAGVMIIFLQGLAYIIDVYLMNANSALSANTFVRSIVGGGFVMFATGMYHNLGVDWATSLLAFLCVALYPAPVLFYIYGERIRKLSRYSPTS